MINGAYEEYVPHLTAGKYEARSRKAAMQKKANDGTEGVRYRISTGDAKSTWTRRDPPRSPSTCTCFPRLVLNSTLFEEAKAGPGLCLEVIS